MKKTYLIIVCFLFINTIIKAQPKQPRFIDDIEIVPGSIVTTQSSEVKNTTPEIKNVKNDDASSVKIEKCTSLQFKYALLMDRNVESINNTALYNFIDSWMDTRYRFGGNDKDGIDCSSFTAQLMNKVYGLTLPRTAQEQYGICTKISKTDLQEGDLVFFNTTGGVSHVGVYLGDNYFVHSSRHSGVTINSWDDDYYSRKYIGGGRITQ